MTVVSLYVFRVIVCIRYTLYFIIIFLRSLFWHLLPQAGRAVCINLGTFFCLLKGSDLILYKCSQCWTKIGYVPYLV